MSRPLYLSVIVPATDVPSSLDECLAQIRPQMEGADELVVVREACRKGAAAARNSGAAISRGDVLVFVDADVALNGDAIGRVRERFRADPNLGALFGRYKDCASPHGFRSTFRNALHSHYHQRTPGFVPTFWTGIGAVRHDLFQQIGGFNDDIYREAMIEDVEFGLRLTLAGCTILLDPDIVGAHLKHWSLRCIVRTDILWRAKPWTELLWRTRSWPRRMPGNDGLQVRTSSLLVVVGAFSFAHPRAAIPAVLAVLGATHWRFYRTLLTMTSGARLPEAVALHLLHLCCCWIGAALGIGHIMIRWLHRTPRGGELGCERYGAVHV